MVESQRNLWHFMYEIEVFKISQLFGNWWPVLITTSSYSAVVFPRVKAIFGSECSIRALRSKNSHEFEITISRRILCLLIWYIWKSFTLYWFMLVQFFSSFCCAVFEIFHRQIFDFSKVGVPYSTWSCKVVWFLAGQ